MQVDLAILEWNGSLVFYDQVQCVSLISIGGQFLDGVLRTPLTSINVNWQISNNSRGVMVFRAAFTTTWPEIKAPRNHRN